LGLPDGDGMDLLARWRARGIGMPLLVLTARDAVSDRVRGLQAGADDYLLKPFDLDELEARIRALARRSEAAPGRAAGGADSFAGLSLDAASGAVCLNGAPMDLAPREAAMLRALLARPGQAVAKERLVETVFPGEDVQPDAIEVVAYRLRKRLASTGVQLVTLRGLGYLLKAASA
ncbi:response regulator, partial [Piscinibacter sp.]|uniref:response regulator n=1 Tax=Piscinibacter sp. TaxID=1903157 RepID=UPI003782F624